MWWLQISKFIGKIALFVKVIFNFDVVKIIRKYKFDQLLLNSEKLFRHVLQP